MERPGDLVTRGELHRRLWPAETFVDFEHGLNAAVKRLRDALGDSAEEPSVVETLPRRGYRLIVPVDGPAAGGAASCASRRLGSQRRPGPAADLVRGLSLGGEAGGREVSRSTNRRAKPFPVEVVLHGHAARALGARPGLVTADGHAVVDAGAVVHVHYISRVFTRVGSTEAGDRHLVEHVHARAGVLLEDGPEDVAEQAGQRRLGPPAAGRTRPW